MAALKFILLFTATLYLVVVAALYFLQTSMLFPGAGGGDGPLPDRAEQLEALAANGDRLHGLYVPAARGTTGAGPVILGFGGNAWNAASAASYLHDLFPGADVVVFHFRGYAPSGGRTSAAALLADAPVIHDLVASRFPGRPIVAVGFSVGTGIAAHLARHRDLAGLILVTPFDSLGRLAAGYYPWLPVRLLIRHRMEPAADLRHSRVPVALIAAERDRLIPPARTAALRPAIGNLVHDRTIVGVGHNDIYQDPAFHDAMRKALDAIEASWQTK
jgi:uncharacterized protein